MRRWLVSLLSTLTLLPIAGCSNDVTASSGGTGGEGASTSSGTIDPNGKLPCEVAGVLERCIACHSNPPTGGSGVSLVTYSDLVATSPKGGTFAERAVARMGDANAPMPPAPGAAATSDEIATIQSWIDGGYASGECADPVDPYATPETCTSAVTWAGEEDPWNGYGRGDMHPGARCIDCHQHPAQYSADEFGPGMWFAGTVFPTAHEPNECLGFNGVDAQAKVEVTDANGQVFTAQVRRSGNFFAEKKPGVGPVAYPIRARVVSANGVREMTTAVEHGDCNTCHTNAGTDDAPGRIVAP